MMSLSTFYSCGKFFLFSFLTLGYMWNSVYAIDVQMYEVLALKCGSACRGINMPFTNIFLHLPIWLENTVKYSQAFFQCGCADPARAVTGQPVLQWVLISLTDEIIENCKAAVGESRFDGRFMLRAQAPNNPVYSCNMDPIGRPPLRPTPQPSPSSDVNSTASTQSNNEQDSAALSSTLKEKAGHVLSGSTTHSKKFVKKIKSTESMGGDSAEVPETAPEA